MSPSPKADITSPVSPLELELQRGCADDAVDGGMSGFISGWRHATEAQYSPELRRRVSRIDDAFRQYGTMSSDERQDLCARTLKALNLYRSRYRSASQPPAVGPGSSVRFMRGVGPKRAAQLEELGITTVRDLLRHYPVRYDDRRNCPAVASLEHRQSATIRVTVTEQGQVKGARRRSVAEVPATDGTTPVSIVWFGQPYRARQFEPGHELLVTGQVMIRKGEYSIVAAETEVLSDADDDAELSAGRLTPIYRLTAGVTQGFLRGLIKDALDACEPMPSGVLPDDLCDGRGLIPLPLALRQIHFPDDDNIRRAARARISFEELFTLQAALARRRAGLIAAPQGATVSASEHLDEFVAALPYELTGAQERVIGEIASDLEGPQAANRLIHGDVGSGKTVCAALALFAAARSGKQGAIMAPTELLAEQHYKTIGEMLKPLGLTCRLLVGSMGETAKKYARRRIQAGEDSILIGTHTLFQESVNFRNLAVAVIDEQHRFGVRQRAQLSAKGLSPNVFVMSATPIPRTLAITAYGDFEVSVLDEMPPGRRPVSTEVAWGNDRRRCYETLAARVVAGRQAYVVCPLIDGGTETNLATAESEYYRLKQGPFASFEVGLLHGKMDTGSRDEVMERFRAGKIEILVATTVIEVGVDVPNATVMLIENAERFGLAQLHQLRGRVGRGEHDSICMLLTRAKAPDVIERLQILARTNDGFEIAEEDLRRRGPGELTGTRQSGLPDLRMADLVADTQTLVKARQDAFALVQADPGLELPQHRELREVLEAFEAGADDWAM